MAYGSWAVLLQLELTFAEVGLLPWLLGDSATNACETSDDDVSVGQVVKESARASMRSASKAMSDNWYQGIANRLHIHRLGQKPATGNTFQSCSNRKHAEQSGECKEDK